MSALVLMVTRVLLPALASILAITSPGWAGQGVDVVVSIEPQRWLVEAIGGDWVTVGVLVQPGESPATYMPTDAQVTSLMRSTVYFRIGAPFENGSWFDAVTKSGRISMVDLRQGIELREDDPHIWLSPRLLSIQARTVAEAMSRVDPNHRADYLANLERLQASLVSLDSMIRLRLEPFSGRKFFVFHPSWGYFAKDYGLEQVAIESGGREPSDSQLTALQRQAKQASTTTVFVQPQIQGRGARAFAEAIGARLEILDPLAADVGSNLRQTADKLVQAFSEEPRGER
jgi:zinc transport system substrate-binding protein